MVRLWVAVEASSSDGSFTDSSGMTIMLHFSCRSRTSYLLFCTFFVVRLSLTSFPRFGGWLAR
jgi:hypothetical protein